jgi:hypothetical protein
MKQHHVTDSCCIALREDGSAVIPIALILAICATMATTARLPF